MFLTDPTHLPVWHLVTRLGEAEILLPASLLAALALLRRAESRPLAAWWVALLGAGVVLTTASKIAFIGWGIGWPALDFTGISGHAMFSAAVYPLLFKLLVSGRSPRTRWLALGVGVALALLVGVSRVVVGAHSVSEVVAGLMVGGTASAGALALVRMPPTRLGPALPATVAVWLALMVVHAPASRTHTTVTRLALKLAGHSTPFTRSDLMNGLRSHLSVPLCAAPGCERPHKGA
jgi:membrane-associated phospholipid phosphatase